MIQLLIVFILSGMLIAAMLALKAVGFSGLSISLWTKFRTAGDERIGEDISSIKAFLKKCDKEHFYKLLYIILVKIRKIIRAFQHWLDRRLSRLKNLIRGRRDLPLRGRASHFLHDIKRSREKEREEFGESQNSEDTQNPESGENT